MATKMKFYIGFMFVKSVVSDNCEIRLCVSRSGSNDVMKELYRETTSEDIG